MNGDTGAIEEVNESFTLLTGWRRKDIKGCQLNKIIPERSRSTHDVERSAYMENPKPKPMGSDREVYLLCKDGSEVLTWIGLSPIPGGLVVATILPQDGPRPGPLNPKEVTK